MLTTFILVVHALIAIALVSVILLQRSEGGALGIGGGGGLMSARGAADLLTRATAILGSLFIVTSIALAVLAASSHRGRVIDTTLSKPLTAPASGPGGIEIVPQAAPAAATPPATSAPVTPAPVTPAPIDQVPVAK